MSVAIRRTRAENASFVIDGVRALGIEPNPASRLMQMYRVLTEAAGVIRPDDPTFPIAVEAERDMQLLGFVFDQSNPHRARNDFRFLVRRMLKDSALPQESREQSPGRDSQFELFIAAICQSAGLTPVDYEEPDVTCSVEGIKFGIAAKRLKSVSGLEEHLKKAAQQIERARLPGIVALDPSLALNRNNDRIATPIPEEQFGLLYKQAMNRFVDEYARKIGGWVVGKGVRGVVFHDHQIRLGSNGEWGLDSMTFWLRTAQDNEQAKQEYSSFHDSYLRGLPNLKHP